MKQLAWPFGPPLVHIQQATIRRMLRTEKDRAADVAKQNDRGGRAGRAQPFHAADAPGRLVLAGGLGGESNRSEKDNERKDNGAFHIEPPLEYLQSGHRPAEAGEHT
jgi:hypothetical protein